jgi:hypothetical protein
MNELNHGDHVCFVFSGMEEQLAGLVPYIAQGLERGEQCFCVQHGHTVPRLLKALSGLGIDVIEEIRRGALVIRHPSDVYLPGGSFEPQAMVDLLSASLDAARRAGFSAFRVTGDMSWALAGKPGSIHLLKYEETMHAFFKNRPAIGMCQYYKNQFPVSKVQKTLLTHGVAFLEDERLPNHYQVRLRKSNLYADIIRSKKPVEVLHYHYVVQRDGSSEVLSWGQTSDLHSAKAEAESILHQHLATRSA